MSPKKKRESKKEKKAREQAATPEVSEPCEDSCSKDVEKTKSGSRPKRGVAASTSVLAKKALGKKIKVTYDSLGNPNGSTRAKLQSYIGLQVRTMIPINIKSWPKVDAELKDRLWTDIQNTFKVAPESRKLVLSSAGVKFRAFKTFLTKKFVLPLLGNPKNLRKPPKEYKFVGVEPWKEFVKQRKGDDWKNLHESAKERVKKRKYHHRLSRKGYVGLEEEMRSQLPEGEDIDRAAKWILAHKPKDGSINEDLEQVSSQIDQLLEKKAKGELDFSGSEDVLTHVLGTSEHTGRLRGVGGFVSPSTYFKLPRKSVKITKSELIERDKLHTKELEETKKRIAELEEQHKVDETFRRRVVQLEGLMKSQLESPRRNEKNVFSPLSDKGSCQGPENVCEKPEAEKKLEYDDCEVLTPNAEMVGACDLAVGTQGNVVAFGTAYKRTEMSDKLHTGPIPDGCIRVSVDGAISEDAPLPFPITGERETVGQAVGCFVPWPEKLVTRKGMQLKPKKLKKTFVVHKMVPKEFSLLYKHAKTFMMENNLTLQAELSTDVFGAQKELFVLPDDIINLLEMNMIGQAAIGAYMAHLHDVFKEKDGWLDDFAFVDPAKTYNPERKEFVPYLVNRLKEGKADRLFLLPYNPGGHWVLAAILENEIYLMDSMPRTSRYRQWEDSLINAIKAFNAETGRFNKAPNLIHLAGAPKQPGGTECGYYVMRYMKDIVSDETYSFSTKWAVKSRPSLEYSQQKLDEVRSELAVYLQGMA